MNLSGEAVRAVMDYYKINIEDTINEDNKHVLIVEA